MHSVILGLGRSGQAAAALALKLNDRVTVIDSRPEQRVEGCEHRCGSSWQEANSHSDMAEWGRLILSPGIPTTHPLVQAALQHNVEVVGELGFAAEHINKPMLAVTGTNGKSSTAWYTHQLLELAGLRSFVGGNFGTALSEMAINQQHYDVAVVEVSSYQLEFPNRFHPAAAALLNVTPDHLKRHKTVENYAAIKRRIFAELGSNDLAIVHASSTPQLPLHPDHSNTSVRWIGREPGVLIEDATLRFSEQSDRSIDLSNVQLIGQHNLSNLAAALMMVEHIGVAVEDLDLSQITPLEHRLEPCSTHKSALWINDSKATNVEATLAALNGIKQKVSSQQRLHLLLGGQGKLNADYGAILRQLHSPTTIYCYGASGAEIAESLLLAKERHIDPQVTIEIRRSNFSKVLTLQEIIATINTRVQPGDLVLLSPACASFDQFKNFEVRGAAFKQLVAQLA